jgi:hypothetical protein
MGVEEKTTGDKLVNAALRGPLYLYLYILMKQDILQVNDKPPSRSN